MANYAVSKTVTTVPLTTTSSATAVVVSAGGYVNLKDRPRQPVHAAAMTLLLNAEQAMQGAADTSAPVEESDR